MNDRQHRALVALGLLMPALALLPARATGQRVLPPAQRPPRLAPLLRVDAIAGADVAVHGAVGATATTAYNTRLELVAGAGGVSRRPGWQPAGRADLLGRWLSDPFLRSRWALAAGGGIGVMLERGRDPRPVGVVVIGVDGPVRGQWMPGIELALGGGVRAGATLRRVRPGRR